MKHRMELTGCVSMKYKFVYGKRKKEPTVKNCPEEKKVKTEGRCRKRNNEVCLARARKKKMPINIFTSL